MTKDDDGDDDVTPLLFTSRNPSIMLNRNALGGNHGGPQDSTSTAAGYTACFHHAPAEWRRIVSRGEPWTDTTFPPERRSIEGPEQAAKAAPPASAPSAPPLCRCGQAARRAQVQKDTPNKGRAYFHCGSRRCGFFTWADGGAGGSGARRMGNFSWRRFPAFVLVSDFGFSATDLRQGGVGDCWFLSALAVVAERHDLVARLFAETAVTPSGCYCVRFFLDGAWTSVLVDDLLPCTSAPRRADQVFDTGLAFSRAANSQLWVCLLEKAYAKAHGSYRAISGGEIAEALLDLTGAPTFTLSFDDPGFDMGLLWARLLHFRAQGYPMGCATAADPSLREVGLCGSHAYSILECREVRRRAGGPPVRLVRIRNPHGEGEWSGEWSDASAAWSDELLAGMAGAGGEGLERTGVDDGTFWMDLTHFVMGFSLVDVCLAPRGWHARSFPNAFPPRGGCWRVCRDVYRVRTQEAGATLYLMGLQPTRRGAWCRADRKKSYRLGDIAIFVARLDANGHVAMVAGGALPGAAWRGRCIAVATLDDPTSEYLVVPFNLGGPPSAAETSAAQPFSVRFFSSAPLAVDVSAFHAASHGQAACATLHHGLEGLGQRAESVAEMPPPLVQRRVCGLSEAVQALTLECEGAVVCIAANRGRAAVTVEVCAKVKVMLVRGGDDGGLLANETEEAERSNAEERSKPKTRAEEGWGNRGGGGVRWPAKWRHFRAVATVPGNGDGRDAALSCPGGHQRLVMMLLPNGMQAEVGSITWSLVGHAGGGAGKDRRQPGSQASTSGEGGDEKGRGRSAQLHQSALADWLRPGIREKASSSAGIFAPVPLIENLWREMPRRERGRPADDDELAEALARSAHEGETGPRGLADADVEDAMLIAALAQSAREAQATRGGDDEDAVLARVLRQSHHGSEQMASWVQDEDTALAAAIAASAQEAGIADPSLQAAVSLMKPAVAASLPRDPLPSPAVARSGHACSRGEEGRSDSQSTAPCSMASEVIVLDADEDDDVGGKDSVSGNTDAAKPASLMDSDPILDLRSPEAGPRERGGAHTGSDPEGRTALMPPGGGNGSERAEIKAYTCGSLPTTGTESNGSGVRMLTPSELRAARLARFA
ncbi:hypothetical protein CYMTET_12209 [Cymbomonas tetramitiformis]|uniref:Calpain catalytic domain-containing protein n=1 Tax=Cymbomonas tetramitiformis TaxID=36881 RepID=A0AAE0GKY2_9CHLO|nr:hypothetical protein CYMTET_12209 [Cymbomonas tetramitiformis]